MPKKTLETKVGVVSLATPLMLASGYITETPKAFLRARVHGCAAMVTRSLKERIPPERRFVPSPRYVVPDPMTMLNCEWGNEHPWENWRDGWAKLVRDTGSPLIISLSGRDMESCVRLVKEFDRVGVDAYEINVSCSHSGALHGNLNVDVGHLRDLMSVVRPITTTPIWIKLSYSTHLWDMAVEAERLGADAIVCTNSIGPGLLLDIETGTPKLGIMGGAGGVTGKAIFPIALACVYGISKRVGIPVVGAGGVFTAEDAIQMLMAGASAVQLYTAPALGGPGIFSRIVHELADFLERHPEYERISDLIGVSHGRAEVSVFTAPRPEVIEEDCTGCGKCYPSCAFGAIRFDRRPGKAHLAVITDECVSCNACVGVCPPEFGAIQARFDRVK